MRHHLSSARTFVTKVVLPTLWLAGFTLATLLLFSTPTHAGLKGSVTATLVPIYPPNSGLPNVMVEASFFAPHVGDLGN